MTAVDRRPRTGATERIAEALDVSPSTANRLAGLAIVAIAVFVVGSLATRGPLVTAAVGLILFSVSVSFRWPLLPLIVYAALVPIEELLVLGTFGTISRYAGILFIAAYGIPRLGRLRIGAMPIPAWAYLGWAILSVGWALDPQVALEELSVLLLLFMVATFVAIAVAERPSIVRPILWAYSLSATITAIVGIAIYASGGGGGTDRVAALPGQDPAHYAALLLPAFAFSLYQLVEGRVVLLSGAVAALCFAGVVVSGTRGAWLSAIVVLAIFILPRLSLPRRMFSVLAMLMILFGALQVPAVATLVADRAGNALSSGGAGRTDIWTVGITIFKSAPVAGVGVGNFPVAYTPEAVRDSDVGIYSTYSPSNRAPHSILVGTLGELGLVGLTLLALFLVPLLLRRGWGPDARAVQAALASLAVSAMFLDVLNRKQVWLFIGVACGLAYVAQTEHARTVWRSLAGRAAAVARSSAAGSAMPAARSTGSTPE